MVRDRDRVRLSIIMPEKTKEQVLGAFFRVRMREVESTGVGGKDGMQDMFPV